MERVKPFVDDNGIYVPYRGGSDCYQCLITKELFVEAYNKWIKPQNNNFIYIGKDTADDWCD
jgi:hypothetical protein